MEAPSDRDADIARLRAYELALLVVLVAHVADHVRQGRPTTTSIGLLGVLSFAGVVVASALALLRHRWAGPAAVLIGIGTATGLVAVHVLPRWSFLSDSFAGSGVDALSWAILAAYALIALATAAAGVRVSRLRRVPLPTYGRAMVDGAHVRSDRGYAP